MRWVARRRAYHLTVERRGGGASRLASRGSTIALALGLFAAACSAPLASVVPSMSPSESPFASDSEALSPNPTSPTPLPVHVIASPPPAAAAWRAVPIAARGRVEDIIQLVDGSYLAVGAIDWNGAVWRSGNGFDWVEVTDVPPIGPQDAKGLTGVIETANGLLAWGGGGARFSEGGFTVVWTSQDGTRWIEGDRWTGFLIDVIEGGPGFVGVGSQAGLDYLYGALAWSSTDGVSWTESPLVPGAAKAGMFSIVPFDGGFLAVGASRDEFGGADGRVWRSEDGIAWSQTDVAALTSAGLSGVILSNGRLLAASWTTLHTIFGEVDRTGIRISDDGVTWTPAYAPDCCGQMLDIVDTGSGLLALYRWYVPEGPNGAGLLRSDDGTRWDVIGAPPFEAGGYWTRLRNVGGPLGVVGLAVRSIGNDEYQPLLLLPPPDLTSD